MIEISRTFNLGQFVNNDSYLTRLNPRTKLIGAILLIALFSYVHTFTAFFLCLLICISLQALSKISVRYLARSFRTIVPFLIFFYFLQVLFYVSPTAHTTLLWHWSFLSLSIEGLLQSLLTIIRALLLYYLVLLLTVSTSMVGLTDALESLLSPLQKIGLPVNEFVMVLVIAFKFVPIFIGEAERLIKAQAARGVRFDQGNLIQRATRYGALLIPLFLSGFKRSETLATAMEARCYGGGRRGWRRSKRREFHYQRSDYLAVLITALTCLVIVVVNILVHI